MFPLERDGFKAGRGYTLTLAPCIVYWQDGLLEVLRRAEMTGGFVWHAVGAWWVYHGAGEEGGGTGGGGIGEMVAGMGVKVAKAGMGIRAKGKGGWNKGRNKKPEAGTGISTQAAVQGEAGSPSAAESTASTATTTTTLRTIPPLPTPTPTPTAHLKETPHTFSDIAWDPSLTDLHRTTLASFLRSLQSDLPTADPTTTTLHTLLTTTFPLPPSLINHIHALTLLPTPPAQTPLSLALPRLKTHLASLGKLPDARSAAALSIGFGGAAEMCQVFARGAAVAGGINVLGRAVERVTRTSGGGKWEVRLSTGENVVVGCIVGGRWDLPSPLPIPIPIPTPLEAEAADNNAGIGLGFLAVAKGVYVVDDPLEILFKPKYPDERIAPGGCVVAVFPEGSGSGKPVYIHARASSPGECPAGKALLYAVVGIEITQPPAPSPGMGMGMEGCVDEGEVQRAYRALDAAVEKVLGRVVAAAADTSASASATGADIDTSSPPPPPPRDSAGAGAGGADGIGKRKGVIYKLQYIQYAQRPSTPPTPPTPPTPTTPIPTTPTPSSVEGGFFMLDDLSLEIPLQGGEVVSEVVGVYEKVLALVGGEGGGGGKDGAGAGEGAGEGFLMVGEEVRRVMREMQMEGGE